MNRAFGNSCAQFESSTGVCPMEIALHEQEVSEVLDTGKRKVTYQLVFSGRDGMVIASDQCERLISSNGQFGVKNMVRKIRIDQTCRFAWAYSGGEVAPLFSTRFSQALDELEAGFSEDDVIKALEASSRAVVKEYHPFSKGPWGCCVTLACGPTKKIFRHKLSLTVEEMLGGFCAAGQEFNLASFLPQRLYSPNLSIDQLGRLAAYAIDAAHDLDSAMIDGLDLAVYRDSIGKFEFADNAFYRDKTGKLDAEIRDLL